MQLLDDNYCFACGKDNPIGLKMEFQHKDSKSIVKFKCKKEHQGWGDVVHGGILFTLMDEIMARMIIDSGTNVVTSRMEISFLRPVKVGQDITIESKEDRSEGRFVYASSKIVSENKKILAKSKGVYVKV